MDFISIGDRYISVPHIRAYETFPEDRGESNIDRIRVSRVWIEGETDPISVTALVYAGWIEGRGPVVPAAPGWLALAYERTETGFEIRQSPIIAWRIIHSFWSPWGQPVTFSTLQDAFDDNCIKAPDGTVWGTASQSWPNEEAWAQEKRKQADEEEAFRRQTDADAAATSD